MCVYKSFILTFRMFMSFGTSDIRTSAGISAAVRAGTGADANAGADADAGDSGGDNGSGIVVAGVGCGSSGGGNVILSRRRTDISKLLAEIKNKIISLMLLSMYLCAYIIYLVLVLSRSRSLTQSLYYYIKPTRSRTYIHSE